MKCNFAIQTGALPSKVRVVGSNPLPGTGSFFSYFLFLHFFPFLSLHCAFTQVYVYARLWVGPARLSGGPSYHRLRHFAHKHSIGLILGLW